VAWTRQRYVVGGVIAVGVLLLISEHGNQPLSGWDPGTSGNSSTSVPSVPSGAGPCTVTVTADSPVRSNAGDSGPVLGTLNKGTEVLAERTVINGYRQLGLSIWVADDSVRPSPGTDCG
jgi:hypothetical protein